VAESFEGEATAAALIHLEYADAPVNNPPVFDSDPFQLGTAEINTQFSATLAGEASDPDGDNIQYSISSGPAWLLCDQDGALSGTPTESDLGEQTWIAQVDDGNGGSDNSSLLLTVIDPSIVSYCSSNGNATNEWIGEVSIGSITNTSASSGSPGYEDFTGTVIQVDAGNNVDFRLVPEFSSRARFEYWRIWIDFNRDGDFEDNGEQVYSSSRARSSVSGTISIPDMASVDTRLRVSMKRNDPPYSCEIFAQGEVEDYTIRIVQAIPQAPIAEFTADITDVTINDVVQFTDLSMNEPVSWSWSFPGGNPSSSTEQNPSITYPATGTYDVSLTVTNSLGSDTQVKSAYINVSEPSNDYCESAGLNTSLEWIESVSIGGNVNQSGAGSGYADYTGISFEIPSGEDIPVILSPGFGNRPQREFWRIWIDLNQDADFDDAGELVFTENNSKSEVQGTFSMPSLSPGDYRMRISLKQGRAPVACEVFDRGEVEDYTVSIGSSLKGLSFNADEDEESIDRELLVYPNPASERLIIYSPGWKSEKLVHLYDLTGKEIVNQKTNEEKYEMDISSIPPGYYILHLSDANTSMKRTVIVY
jgi:PKD repeat protein